MTLYQPTIGFGQCFQEIAMTAAKEKGTRLARWFKTFRDKNRPPYRYYEHSLYDA